jgi:hypothetical protein
MKKLFLLLLILSSSLLAFSQNTAIKYHGIVNENSVRVRESAGLTGNIIGKLNRGDTVLVLGRSQERMYLDGFDSYWLKIATDTFEGWSYGAYVNLTDAQYSSLPVVSQGKILSDPDLNYTIKWADDEFFGEFLIKEREALKQQEKYFTSQTIRSFYDNIVKAFNNQQSLRPFFLNTFDCILEDTDRNFFAQSSFLCDYIQSSYIDNIQISKLYIDNDNSAIFYITGFTPPPGIFNLPIKSMKFNILRVEKTNSHLLEDKIVIDDMVLSPYTIADFNDNKELYENYLLSTSPYFSGASSLLQRVLGIWRD